MPAPDGDHESNRQETEGDNASRAEEDHLGLDESAQAGILRIGQVFEKDVQSIIIGKCLEFMDQVDQVKNTPKAQEEKGDLHDLPARQPGMPEKEQVANRKHKHHYEEAMGPPEREVHLIEQDGRTEGGQDNGCQDEPEEGDPPMPGCLMVLVFHGECECRAKMGEPPLALRQSFLRNKIQQHLYPTHPDWAKPGTLIHRYYPALFP